MKLFSVLRQTCILVLATALFISCAATATAQAGRGGMVARLGGLQMLRTPEVQKELKMTPEQIGKLDAGQQEVREGMQPLFQGGFQGLSAADRRQRMEKIQDLNDKAVSEILDAIQVKRYHQLALQQQGPVAITRRSVAMDLKLTDDQQKKLADIQTQWDTERRAAMSGQAPRGQGDTDREAMATRMQAVQKAEDDRILALLTDAQKAQWKDMQGAPFSFPPPVVPKSAAGR